MTTESVTANTMDATFNGLVGRLERMHESRHAAAPARSKHDVNMVNKASERLAKALAIADLMMTHGDPELVAQETTSNIGWLLFDLLSETKELVEEKESDELEVQS